MSAPHEIISDEEIIRVHGHANFGDMSPREVVNDGVRKYAIGYAGGHTELCILLEHELITKPKPGKYSASLTQKGKRYARAVSATRTDLSQAAVAAALEAAAGKARAQADGWKVAWETAKANKNPKEARDWQSMMLAGLFVGDSIKRLITQRDHDALAAHVAAEVAKARAEDAAKLTKWCDSIQADVLGCIDLYANEEANAVLWINNFRAEIAQIGAKP